MNYKKMSEIAYKISQKMEAQYGECSQATSRGLQEVYPEINNEVVHNLCTFAGGSGAQGDGQCGAYSACIYFFGMKYGRHIKDIDNKGIFFGGNTAKALADIEAGRILVKRLHKKFIEKFGSIICHQIHIKLYGRPYYLLDEDEVRKFLNTGGHDAEKGAPFVCGNAAKWAVEIYEKFKENKEYDKILSKLEREFNK
jgi:hypothetical protein